MRFLRQASPRVFIDDEAADPSGLWERVADLTSHGCEVWLRTPQLARPIERLGQLHADRCWLVLPPRRSMTRAIPWLSRVRDVLLSSIALLSLWPLLLVVAVLVKLSSPGPVFFSTDVVGRNRDHFRWRKFRSMRVLAQEEDAEQRRSRFRAYVEERATGPSPGAPQKVIDEQRVTRVGRLLRKYSIDELPQLWNVLCGEMALVGPRPCLPYEADFYSGWRGHRFDVLPGLSGVWQVFGRGLVGFEEAAAMDVFYVYRRSFQFDLALIFKTINVVLTGKGAL